jgi:hypothetical protein
MIDGQSDAARLQDLPMSGQTSIGQRVSPWGERFHPARELDASDHQRVADLRRDRRPNRLRRRPRLVAGQPSLPAEGT